MEEEDEDEIIIGDEKSTNDNGNIKNDTVSKTSTAALTEERKEIRVKRKRNLTKKKSFAKSKKAPYNEGAEETKNWLAESENNLSQNGDS